MKNPLTGKFTKPIVALAALATIGAGAGATAIVSAQTASTTADTQTATTRSINNNGEGMHKGGFGGMCGHGRGAVGTVTAISGNSITITGENGTSYTVNASDTTKISKMVELTVADIKVGDRIGAEGTLSGTTVTATHIMDGIPEKPAQATSSN